MCTISNSTGHNILILNILVFCEPWTLKTLHSAIPKYIPSLSEVRITGSERLSPAALTTDKMGKSKNSLCQTKTS